MAVTTTVDARQNTNPALHSHLARGLKVVAGTFTFDNSYVGTAGEAVTIPGLTTAGIIGVMVYPKSGYVFEFDKTNSKVKAKYCELSAGTDGVLIDVAASVDLSAVTADFLAIGY